MEKFQGTLTYGGQIDGVDSAVGGTDLSGKASNTGRFYPVGPVESQPFVQPFVQPFLWV